MASAIHCVGLKKTYPAKPPVEAVKGIDLDVQVGECFGLLGPNGAGKTTTIEILEGLLDPTEGSAEVLGLRWGKDDFSLRERIGISFQETRLQERQSVLETLRLFRSFYAEGIDPKEAMQRVSLEEKADAWISKLSGGQKQRLAVACSLVGDPELLFLDEPTTGLDPQSRRQLWDIITQFKDQGRTVLLTTHYMDEAERLCDRIAIVDAGKIIAEGTPRQLISSLGAEHTIEFTVDPREADWLRQDWLAQLPAVQSVHLEDSLYRLHVTEPHLSLPALVQGFDRAGKHMATLSTRHATLEDVFVALTGRHLRDGD